MYFDFNYLEVSHFFSPGYTCPVVKTTSLQPSNEMKLQPELPVFQCLLEHTPQYVLYYVKRFLTSPYV